MEIMKEIRIAPDVTLYFAVSHIGLLCLPLSHNKDACLQWLSEIDLFSNEKFGFPEHVGHKPLW